MTKKTPGKSRPAVKSGKTHRQPAKVSTKPKAQPLRAHAKKTSTSKIESRKKPLAEKRAVKTLKHPAPVAKQAKTLAKPILRHLSMKPGR